jgi:citrate lyase subunit beta / citryl-CoA lyase
MPSTAHSFLFVPADRPERFKKALDSGANCVIIDLEDAVSPAAKQGARQAVYTFFANGGRALLRINALDSEWAVDDLELCAAVAATGVVLPKVETNACIAKLRQYLNQDTPILPLIETAKGLINIRNIASEHTVLRLLFGTVDFCLDLNIDDDDDKTLDHYRSTFVLVSRSEGLQAPVDGVITTLDDMAVLTASASSAKRMGFGGKLCIHPSQVATVNRCFQATAQQLAWAHQVLVIAQSNAGAFQFEGKMVDAPVLALASRLIQSAH